MKTSTTNAIKEYVRKRVGGEDHVFFNPFICPSCGCVITLPYPKDDRKPLTDNNGVKLNNNTFTCSCGKHYKIKYIETNRVCTTWTNYDEIVEYVLTMEEVDVPVGKKLSLMSTNLRSGRKNMPSIKKALRLFDFKTVEYLYSKGCFDSSSRTDKLRWKALNWLRNTEDRLYHVHYAIQETDIPVLVFLAGIIGGIITINCLAFAEVHAIFGVLAAMIDVFLMFWGIIIVAPK